MTKNITVIGAGSWGTALAQVLCDNKNNVTLYDLNQDVVNDINQNHQNSRFFADITLPSSLVATTNLKEALKEAQLILLSVPTKVMRDVLKSINKELDHQVMIINASKGIEPGTHKRVSEIVKEEIDPNYLEAFAALTGPSHAEEVIERAVTTVTCASTVAEKANIIQEMFNNQYFRVYRVDDLIGVEIGDRLKMLLRLQRVLLLDWVTVIMQRRH